MIHGCFIGYTVISQATRLFHTIHVCFIGYTVISQDTRLFHRIHSCFISYGMVPVVSNTKNMILDCWNYYQKDLIVLANQITKPMVNDILNLRVLGAILGFLPQPCVLSFEQLITIFVTQSTYSQFHCRLTFLKSSSGS